jgi:hypothetical protein
MLAGNDGTVVGRRRYQIWSKLVEHFCYFLKLFLGFLLSRFFVF